MRPARGTPRGNITVTTPEEARKAIRRKKELGFDLIKLNEFLPFDLVKVVVDEAHGLGMAVTTATAGTRSSPPNAGVDAIEHIWSVGYSSILYPPAPACSCRATGSRGMIDQEIAGAYYQTENYDPSSRRW